MFFSTEPFSAFSLSLLLFFTISTGSFPLAKASFDYTNLVYKGCANQEFQDPFGVYSKNLKTLISTLVSQSAQKNFSTSNSGEDQNAIFGLFQCRGDITLTQCYTCVSEISKRIEKLCGNVVAARVQLNGCYLRYEIYGFKQVSMTEMLYEVCAAKKDESGSGSVFEQRKEMAFKMAENGIENGGLLFYSGNYEYVFVLGQCEGDLASGDCSDCVKTAFDRAKNDCGNSISGQVYLHMCFVSYSYYSNGVTNLPSSSGEESKQHIKKTVSIAVGIAAALGFLLVCLLCLRSLLKKHSGKHEDY